MIIILMGVSGSGKTTVGQLLADELHWPYYDGDDFHSPGNINKMASGIALNGADRSLWLNHLSQHIRELAASQQNAVISCSALKQAYRDQLQFDPELVRFIYLKGPEKLIKQRLKARQGHFMTEDLLSSQFDTLEEPGDVTIVDINESPVRIAKAIQLHFGLIPKKAPQ